MQEMISADAQRIAIARNHPDKKLRMARFDAACDCRSAAMDAVHPVCIDVIRKAAGTADSGDEDKFFAWHAQIGKHLLGLRELQKQTDTFVGKLQKEPTTVGVLTQFRSRTPQLYLDVDRTKVESLGVDLNDVNQTMQIYLGSMYANSFNAFGRHWQVTLQAAGNFRNQVEDINLLQVRNKAGEMVSLATLVNVKEINGPIFVLRYNLSTAAPVSGSMLPGVSSGEVIKGINRLTNESLPRTMRTAICAWTRKSW